MSTKEAFKQKIEAELELAQAKLLELKAKAKVASADLRLKYADEEKDLEKKMEEVKVKLKELGETSDDAWDRLKDGAEAAWGNLSAAVKDAAKKFKD